MNGSRFQVLLMVLPNTSREPEIPSMTKSMAAQSKNNGTVFVTNVKAADILEREMDF